MSSSPDRERPSVEARRPRGIFDGFEAYRTPSADDFRRVLTTGMVVLDTSFLFNLYRYNPEGRTEVFDVLELIKERLWVPHRVISEFWTSRSGVLKDADDVDTVAKDLTGLRERALQIVATWARRKLLDPAETDTLREPLAEAFDSVIESLDGYGDRDAGRYAMNSRADPVVLRLAGLLEGRVGHPLSRSDHLEAVEEARRRAEQLLPPGYKDAGKRGEAASGDYLIWAQVLAEAAQRRTSVLFVTGDAKEDWWRLEQGRPAGPRPELVQEMRTAAGCELFMLPPTDLLRRARELLPVEVTDAALADVGRVQKLADTGASEGWTAAALEPVLEQLERGYPDRATVIRQAAGSGGFINRDGVYAATGRDRASPLRGFTQPVDRLVASLQRDGRIPPIETKLLNAVAGDDPSGPIAGYRVPDAVVAILTESHSDG
jgi:hypothetical protein